MISLKSRKLALKNRKRHNYLFNNQPSQAMCDENNFPVGRLDSIGEIISRNDCGTTYPSIPAKRYNRSKEMLSNISDRQRPIVSV